MTPPAATGAGRTPLSDEVRAEAPELSDALDAALSELLAEPEPPSDDRLGALLSTGTGVAPTAAVIDLRRARRVTARRMALGGVAVAGALVATTGLAAAAVLPAPVQRAVASAAARIGLDLPEPDEVVVGVAVVPGAQVPEVTSTAPTTSVPLDTSAPVPTSVARPANPLPTVTPAAPPPTAAAVLPRVDAFLAAVAEFRRCVAAAGGELAGCSLPDPAAYLVPATMEPADVAAFRRAALAYLGCLRAAGADREAARRCDRPSPGDFGIGPRPTVPGPPPTVTLPAQPPPNLVAFRAAVEKYLACLRAASLRPAQQRPCLFPDPADFGFTGWPPGVRLPDRANATGQPPPSSSPPSRVPPASAPGVTVTSAPTRGASPTTAAGRPG